MEKIQRIGVSLENQLLEQFDELIDIQGYANRSEAIRDLIREKLSARSLTDQNTTAVGAVFIVYDHHHAQLTQKLIKLQHDSLLESICSMHVHLDHRNCLEVILLKGKISRINALGEKLLSLKGVSLGKIHLIKDIE